MSIVVTEAAKNLIKHGQGGEVLLRGCPQGGSSAPSICSLSTRAKVWPMSLPAFATAIPRPEHQGLAWGRCNASQIFSRFIRSRMPAPSCIAGSMAVETGQASIFSVPDGDPGALLCRLAGETKCGDSWAQYLTQTHSVYMVVDGLGTWGGSG